MRLWLASAAVTILAVSPAFATPITIDFNQAVACPGGCTNGEGILQSFGDVAGLVDITYTDRTGLGNSPKGSAPSLFYWGTGYSGLTGVAWTNAGHTGEVAFGAPDHFVTLLSLDLGNFGRRGGPSKIYIYDGAYHLLASLDPVIVGTTPFHYVPLGGIKSKNGLIVQWGKDAFDVGIDNIRVDVTRAPVPEPGALLYLGLALVGLALRRRVR
jgi:hypothetical protein